MYQALWFAGGALALFVLLIIIPQGWLRVYRWFWGSLP